MSLKAFHVFFIVASSALAFGFGVWEIKEARHDGTAMNWALGIGSLIAGVALLVYERYFLKKTKDVGYL